MAIDTEAKRKAAAGLKPFKKILIPDGVLDAADREQIACLYSGILISIIARKIIELTVKLYSRALNLAIGGQRPADYLTNGNFETGDPPTGYTASRSTIARESTIIKIGSYSMKITCNDPDATGSGQVKGTHTLDAVANRGKQVTLGAWCRTPAANDKTQVLRLFDNAGLNTSDIIPKDDTWHWITVTRTINAAATYLDPWFFVKLEDTADTDDILYVDRARLVEGDKCPPLSLKPLTLKMLNRALTLKMRTKE